MADFVPFAMLSSVVLLDSTLQGWTLLDVPASEPRVFRFEVVFDRAFSTPPLVHVAVAGFDVENHDSARLRVRALDIQESCFTLHVETWLNTRVWAVDVSWLAIGNAA